jgi:ABC-type antimicrobial peptide transport system permease subunit
MGPSVTVDLNGALQSLPTGHGSATFFTMFGGRPVHGRTFVAEEDRPGAPRVEVLSDAFWRHQFGADPRGGSSAHGGPAAASLQSATALPVGDLRTMDEAFAAATAPAARNASIAGVIGSLSVLAAVVGVFGAALYAAQQRTRELAIRLALGAQAHHLRALMLGGSMRITMVGLLAGVAAAAGLTTLLQGMLVGVGPHDPTVFVAAPVALGAATLAAAYLPTRRASTLDPVVVLRE